MNPVDHSAPSTNFKDGNEHKIKIKTKNSERNSTARHGLCYYMNTFVVAAFNNFQKLDAEIHIFIHKTK